MEEVTYIFRVKGMDCVSCDQIMKKDLLDLSYVKSVEIDVSTKTVSITGDFNGIPENILAEDLTILLSPHGYEFFVLEDQ